MTPEERQAVMEQRADHQRADHEGPNHTSKGDTDKIRDEPMEAEALGAEVDETIRGSAGAIGIRGEDADVTTERDMRRIQSTLP